VLNLIGLLLLIGGVLGFAGEYLGLFALLRLELWGGMAVVGAILTVLLRRPAD